MPFADEASTYQRLGFNYGGGNYDGMMWMNWPGNTNYPNGAPNAQVLNRYKPDYMVCPSRPFDEYYWMSNSSTNIFRPNYVWISGSDQHRTADLDPGSGSAPDVPRNGHISAGGIFFVNSSIKMKDITDGASATMFLGEQSDWGYTATNNTEYVSSAYNSGAWMGNNANITPNGSNTNWGSNNNNSRCYNEATIRYAVGQKEVLTAAGAGMRNDDCNTPIQSAHDGGAHVLLGDGSVRFLSASLALDIEKNLADRDDGNPLGEF